MTEKEYADLVDLTKLRVVLVIVRDLTPRTKWQEKQKKQIDSILSKWRDECLSKVKIKQEWINNAK